MNRKTILLVIPAILLIATLIVGCTSPAPAVTSPTPSPNPSQPAADDNQSVSEAMNSTLANLSRIQAGLDEIIDTLSLAEPGSINQTMLDIYQAEIEAYMTEINDIGTASQQYLNESGPAPEPGVSVPPLLSATPGISSGNGNTYNNDNNIENRLTALENEIRHSDVSSMNKTVKDGYMSRIASIRADINRLSNDRRIDITPPDTETPLSPIQYKELIGAPLSACLLAQLQLRCVSLEWTLVGFCF